ncbi:MAG: PhzF family phenazine biosynthesis protein [Gemmatimonadota bacterium]
MNEGGTVLPFYRVDAFVTDALSGNPAGVCPLGEWISPREMQRIAAEVGLSETAFLVRQATRRYRLRWFTPTTEVDLCGHATLASAWVVLHRLEPAGQAISGVGEKRPEGEVEESGVTFDTRGGRLRAWAAGEGLGMDFPGRPAERHDPPRELLEGLGREPAEVWATERDFLAVYETEAEIRALSPDPRVLEKLELPGVIVTAPGERCDFVSRFFAPALGVPEDPVTGSAHCTLAPYWAGRIGRRPLLARQLSPRGGELLCEVRGERVLLEGRAALDLEGNVGPDRGGAT